MSEGAVCGVHHGRGAGQRTDGGERRQTSAELPEEAARLKLLIIDELGFVPPSKTGAELLFEVFSQRYERGSVLVTTNLPFDEWTDVFRVREADRGVAGQTDTPCAHPGDER